MLQKKIIRLAIIVLLLLVIPVFGNMYVDGWNWSPFDFVWAFVVLFGSGLIYLLVSRKSSALSYKAAVGLSTLTGLALVWINGAVGIIGEDNPINLMYLGMLALGFLGAIMARLEAQRMMYVLFVMAVVQMVIPVIALLINPEVVAQPPGVLGVFVLNAGFMVMWLGAGLLFRNATLEAVK